MRPTLNRVACIANRTAISGNADHHANQQAKELAQANFFCARRERIAMRSRECCVSIGA